MLKMDPFASKTMMINESPIDKWVFGTRAKLKTGLEKWTDVFDVDVVVVVRDDKTFR